MATGSFRALAAFCPMCGGRDISMSTQGHGSGEYDVVCHACGWDGGINSYADPEKLDLCPRQVNCDETCPYHAGAQRAQVPR